MRVLRASASCLLALMVGATAGEACQCPSDQELVVALSGVLATRHGFGYDGSQLYAQPKSLAAGDATWVMEATKNPLIYLGGKWSWSIRRMEAKCQAPAGTTDWQFSAEHRCRYQIDLARSWLSGRMTDTIDLTLWHRYLTNWLEFDEVSHQAS